MRPIQDSNKTPERIEHEYYYQIGESLFSKCCSKTLINARVFVYAGDEQDQVGWLGACSECGKAIPSLYRPWRGAPSLGNQALSEMKIAHHRSPSWSFYISRAMAHYGPINDRAKDAFQPEEKDVPF